MANPSHRSRRVLPVLWLAASALAAGACCSPGVRAPGGASAGAPLSPKDLSCDVQIIVVTSDGKTHPEVARVYPHQVVIWVSDADGLTIQWKGTNPFPRPPQSAGRFVYSIDAPTGPPGTYEYTGEIVKGEKHIPIDPRLEIMDFKKK
jgi:hypothetical protein